MSHSRSARRPGFTLVEMLVVLAIIGILAALLLPAVMYAIVRAKTTAVAIELNQLTSAIESYKQDKGDYPPNFRDRDVVLRHIRKCYPKADPAYISGNGNNNFIDFATGVNTGSGNQFICESECLVFWLTMTDNDPRYPFLSYFVGNTGRTPNPKKYIDLDAARLKNPDTDSTPSFEAKNCQETFYIYVDSRSYDSYARDPYDRDLAHFQASESAIGNTYAVAEDDKGIRPYWSTTRGTAPRVTSNLIRNNYKPMNATSFQLICAGLDGEFGMDLTNDIDVKVFPTGENYAEEDKDNITNFSNGGRIGDAIP
jgi:prepilin-type N-terminal cleavage/methylation domain-containing protein